MWNVWRRNRHLLGRAVALTFLLNSCCWLCAFDLQYGSLFNVEGIALQEGIPVLPLSRGKYANVRVLDKDTFDFLRNCASSCKQPGGNGEIEVFAFRAAQKRPGMWIADVSVDEKWLLTFLLFQSKNGIDVVVPEGIKIQNRRWLDKVRDLLKKQVPMGTEEN